MHGPFLTKMLVSMAFPSGSCFRYCASALPPCGGNRLQFHRQRNGIRHVGDAHDGRTGIISSVTANGCSAVVSTNANAFLAARSGRLPPRFSPHRTNPVTADGAFSALVDIFQQPGCSCCACSAVSFTACWPSIDASVHRLRYQQQSVPFRRHNDVVIERSAFDDGLSGTGEVAVSSTTTGGLPAPAAIRRLLCVYAPLLLPLRRRLPPAGRYRKLEQALRGFDIRICHSNQ